MPLLMYGSCFVTDTDSGVIRVATPPTLRPPLVQHAQYSEILQIPSQKQTADFFPNFPGLRFTGCQSF